MMDLKRRLRNSRLTKGAYLILKTIKDNREMENKLKCKYKFVDRSKNRKKLCIVLSGYKPFLYETVFGRLAKYMEDDIDVCVITSGLFSTDIDKICAENNWSYLSTKQNHVGLVQNVAISLHPSAEYIFKLDEDIFITKGYFSKMFNMLIKTEEEGDYYPGFVAPLITINGYCYRRILEKLGLVEYYKNIFGEARYASNNYYPIGSNSEIAKFFWGEGDVIPSIDEMNSQFERDGENYSVCPIRYSIGAILFRRSFFYEMGMFKVDRFNNPMGKDESEICTFSMLYSRAIIVAENIVVGHLSFGPQNEEMKKYYKNHRERFSLS